MTAMFMAVNAMMPTHAETITIQPDPVVITVYNPLYSRTAEDASDALVTVPAETYLAGKELPDLPAYNTADTAGQYIRSCMVNRDETIMIEWWDQIADLKMTAHNIMDNAFRHTGNSTEGDYLAFQYEKWSASVLSAVRNNRPYYIFVFNVTYYTSRPQEEALTGKLEEIYEELQLNGLNDYERLGRIYDYVIHHVRYDDEHMHDGNYKPQYTAYAAVFDHTAVCQGYAVLLYRMLLDNCIKARIVYGTGGYESHAWNIAAIQGKYYSLDATWDSEDYTHDYLLKGTDAFYQDHDLDPAFMDHYFVSSYPMPHEDYVRHDAPAYQFHVSFSHATMAIGSSSMIHVDDLVEDAENRQVYFVSDNPAVVSINRQGVMECHAIGQANITITAEDGGSTEVILVDAIDQFAIEFGFSSDSYKEYWYENHTRQGMYGDPRNITDTLYGLERGREIYDPASDGWYWLDAIYNGAKAVSKEVWMPYIYQEDLLHGYNPQGKWVRYDASGKMIKGWYTVEEDTIDQILYPSQLYNTYYYDLITGQMIKGWYTTPDGVSHHFDEQTGVLLS